MIPFLKILCLLSATTLLASAQEDGMISRTYEVPPAFFQTFEAYAADPPADPFANPVDPSVLESYPAKKLPPTAGLSFGEGASLVATPTKGRVTMQNTSKEHDLLVAFFDRLKTDGAKTVSLRLEYIEVDQSLFDRWIYENRLDSDGTELRTAAQEWLEAENASFVETVVATGSLGERLKAESIEEYIYPTEYDPPEIPHTVTLAEGATSPVTSISATAFETRNLGVTLEADVKILDDDRTIEVDLAPEIVRLIGRTEWPNEDSEVLFSQEMPTFYTQKITTQITLRHGRYGFLGTTKPYCAVEDDRAKTVVLQFLRADIGYLDQWSVVDAE